MADHMRIKLSLAVKLVSAIVHADEFHSVKGHPNDLIALKELLVDPEVKQFMKDMGPFAPVKR